MRLSRYAVQGTDLVEIGFKEAFLGECFSASRTGVSSSGARSITWMSSPRHRVGLVGLADNDEDQRFVGCVCRIRM